MLDLSNIWPEWKAVELIGEGSFGKVYKCVREEYGMKFESAVKVISIPSSRAEIESMSFEGLSEAEVKSYFNDIVVDFANEIKLMFMLKGAANIVSVENYKIVERRDEVGWEIYILMEYLTSFVAYSKNKKFTEAEVKRFALDIINALDICSRYKIIHRDIKPDNIFVDRFGSFKLGDFGVAKQLESSMSMMSKKGTYSYMAPEVFRGEKYDFRADIYSLGMVMYKLLNHNKDPFIDHEKAVVTYKDRNEAIERRRRGEKLPAPIDASPEMAAVILKACEFNAADRFSSIEEFKEAVEEILIKKAPKEEPTLEAEDKTLEVQVPYKTVAAFGNEPTDYSLDATVLADEATVFADDERTVFALEATVMADEATAFDDDTTVMAESENKSARVVDYSIKSPDEPTVIAEKKETELSKAVKTSRELQHANEDKEEIKELVLLIIAFIIFCIVAMSSAYVRESLLQINSYAERYLSSAEHNKHFLLQIF